jgi:homoserine dehydrogenase
MDQFASPVVIANAEEQQQITPIQTKMVINLQRSVRFQLTPSTDARLVAKEQIEETLRGSKPDIVIEPTPMVAEAQPTKAKATPAKKAAKPKKKVLTSKKKKVTPKKKAEPVC